MASKAGKRTRTPARCSDILAKVDPRTSYHALLEVLPGVAFFAKDRSFRIIAANRLFYERFGFQSEFEIIGRDDYELFPSRLAENFRRDDAEVMRTGCEKRNVVELFFNRQGIPDWFITHKLPMFNRRRQVIGVMGITQSYTGAQQALQPYLAIDRAVSCIRERYREPLTVAQLASYVHLSPRQLQRRFVETFGCSPQAFILKVRIQAACDLLQHGDRLMAEVARDSGFKDQSAFAQHFRRHIGATPRQYQARFRLVRG
jgi:AraC-like DNA-binding protein